MGYTFFKAEIRSYEKKHFYQEVLCFGNPTFEKHNLCIRGYLSKNTLTEDFAKKCIEMARRIMKITETTGIRLWRNTIKKPIQYRV